ncbi:MAG: OsmC family protein [Akkermansiaceae bacterium]|nr:OsmC family protein [Akkermansiaceae bacterium]
MIEIRIDYTGELHCDALHEPSGTVLSTDAPVDNHGRGETFSSTDLVATALGTCMATVMGIAAQRKNLSLQGMRLAVRKYMASDQPRRIERLDVEIFMPLPEDHIERKLLQSTVLGCPVQHSIHPDIEVVINWHWAAEE